MSSQIYLIFPLLLDSPVSRILSALALRIRLCLSRWTPLMILTLLLMMVLATSVEVDMETSSSLSPVIFVTIAVTTDPFLQFL